ncbi:MAG: hypothetical protein ACYS8W_07820 [Planctomycetota bacterium]|jgi:hypothetical protein
MLDPKEKSWREALMDLMKKLSFQPNEYYEMASRAIPALMEAALEFDQRLTDIEIRLGKK